MIVRIDTLEDERLNAYARLTEAQLRNKLEPEKGIFIAESGKVIERALEGGMQPLSLLMEEKWLPSMASIVERIEQIDPTIPVFVAPHDELQKLCGFELTRGALGAFRRPRPKSVAEACEGARVVAVLEDITNHTNVGAIFRSAAALGVDAVLDPRRHATTRSTAARCAFRWAPCFKFPGRASGKTPTIGHKPASPCSTSSASPRQRSRFPTTR